MDFLRYMDFTGFWSFWYWLLQVITWSMISHWTLGVPYDMILRANRQGGDWAHHCDSLCRASIFRLTQMFRTMGPAVGGVAGFVLAVLATLGFYVGVEVARALFVLMVPVLIVSGMSVRLAFRLEDTSLDGAALRKAISKRRLGNQVIGFFAIVGATIVAVFELNAKLFVF